MRLRSSCALMAVLAPLLLGCSDEPDAVAPPGGGGAGGGGGGGGDTVVVPSCGVAEAARPDGSCVQVGVAQCAAGFSSDDDGGCDPVVPEGACPAATMKVLGEAECVDVAPCSGKWGRAPIESNTQFVDPSYPGMDSDGSEPRPWTTVDAALAAAEDGAVVALAAGYYGSVVVLSKSVRLWGACPAAVEIATMDAAGVFVEAPGAEVHDLSVTDAAYGVVSVAPNTLIEGVWVHDTSRAGLFLDGDYGTDVSATVRHSAITHATDFGIADFNADLAVTDVHVYEPLPDESGESGRGVRSRPGDTPTSITIDGLVVERCYSVGLQLAGVTADITRLYVDDTQGRMLDGVNGAGLDIVPWVDTVNTITHLPTATIDGAVVARSHGTAVQTEDATTTLTNVVLRDVLPDARTITNGQAVNLLAWTTNSSLTMRSSLVERSVAAGVFVSSRAAAKGGQGEAQATLEQLWVRDIAAKENGDFGIGIVAQGAVDGVRRSALTVRDSLVTHTAAAGMFVLDSTLTLSGSEIRDVSADGSGEFGDGVIFQPFTLSGEVTVPISQLFVRNAARAGVANFGGVVDIDSIWVDCSAFPLNGEAAFDGTPFTFNVSGDNRCSCDGVAQDCRVLSSGLSPPEPFQ